MRILTVNNHFGSGGASSVVVEYLRELHKTEHIIEVCTIYTIGSMAQPLLDLGIKFYNFEQNPQISMGSSAGKYDFRLVFKLAQVIRQGHYDIVHVHTFPSSLIAALASLLAPGPRYVFTEHNAHNRRRGKRIVRYLDHFIYSRYQAVISVSQNVQDALVEWQPFVEAKAYIVRNSIDSTRLQFSPEERAEIRAALKLLPEDVVIFFGGRFERAKGLDVLVQAVAQLERESALPFKVLLAGSGVLEGDLRQQVNEAGLAERFEFLGFRKDIPQLLAAADIMVLPSRWEGLPMILLEALGAHKPVVATCVGGIGEVIKDDVSGFLVEPEDVSALADRLSRLINSGQLRSRLGEAGYSEVKARYSVDVSVPQLLEIYRSILKERANAV